MHIITTLEERLWHCFPKKHNIRLHKPLTLRTPWNLLLPQNLLHLLIRKLQSTPFNQKNLNATINTPTSRKTPMRLNNIISFNPRNPFQSINILRKTPQKNTAILQQSNKSMRKTRLKLPRIQRLRKGIKRLRILAEILQGKHCLWEW
jgi:hypothetical protein